MSRRLFRSLPMLVFAALLRAQTFASHFEDITVDRRLPLDLPSGLAVEPASGALDVSIPLGPGIGEGGVRFSPTLRGHLAPQISWVRTSAPSNRLDASSQATFSLQPGSLDLKLTSHFDTDARTAVSGFELWNGISGTFHLDKPLPEFEDPIDADRLIQAFGYDKETVGKAPHPKGESAGRMVKYATDGSLVLALGGPTILTPITSGVGDHVSKGTVESPARVLLIRQGIAYEFTTLYDSRLEGQFGNIWFSRFRLAGIRNKFGDHIRIEYKGNGLDGPANQMGFEAEYFRSHWATGQKVSLTVGTGGDSRVPIRIAYAASQGPTPVFDLDTQVEYLDLVPEGVSLWDRKEIPEWCDLSRRLLVHEVSNTGAGQWIRFSYDSPSCTFAGVSLTHRLLGKVAWSNGRSLSLQWKDYPYRRNDARPGKWQGYFSQYFDSPGGSEQDKRCWTYGVTSWIDSDTVTRSERRTQYMRTVPLPRWGSRHSWDDQRFHTAIVLPDGQVRLEKYARPVQGLDGGLDTTHAYQIRTLAHLRHMVEQVRLYARGVDWQADVDRPASDSTAYRVETYGFNVGQEGYPGRYIDQGAYPRAYARQNLNRDNGVLDTGMEGQWDCQACAPGQSLRVIQRGQTRLYAEETRRSFEPLPQLGMLTRPSREVRTVSLDAPACVSSQSILPQTWETGRILDEADGGILDRTLGTRETGPGGPTLETRSTYRADAGPEARLVSRVDLSSRDLSGSAGAAYAYDELGRLKAIRPKGVDWGVKQTLDGLGRTESRTDANGRVTAYRWDDAGRLILLKPPRDEEETLISYHHDGRGKSIARGVQRSSLRFNAFGDLIRETKAAEGGVVHRRWGFDQAGRMTWATVWLPGEGEDEGWQGNETDPCTAFYYDERGRIVQEIDPNEEVTTTSYGADTCKVTKGVESTVYWFDHLDRLARVTNALGESTAYGYDPAGRMTVAAQEDPGTGARQRRTWAYNGPGWLAATDQPETGPVIYGAFTVLGKPRVTAFKGDGTGPARVLNSTFDGLGRLESRVSTDGTVDQSFAYDVRDAGGRTASAFGQANGKPTYARDGNVETFRSYSGAGGSLSGLDTQVWPGGSVGSGRAQVFPQTYKQDELGHRILATAGEGKVATGYARAQGIATSVSRNEIPVARGALDEAGNLVVLDFANGVQGTSRFGPDQHRLKALGYAKGSTSLAAWNLAYDARGVLLSNGEDRFEHDPLARLKKVTASRLGSDGRADPSQMVAQSFGYDTFGNRISSLATGALQGESGFTNNFAYDLVERKALGTRNRIPSKAGGLDTGAAYDAQGNVTAIWKKVGSARTVMTLSYDALGRVTEVWDGSKETTERYGYSPEGLRTLIEQWNGSTLSKRVLHLHDDGGRLVSQYEGAPTEDLSWKRDLIHLGRRTVAEIDSAGTHTLLEDAQGSIRLVTNAEGRMEAFQKFLPYGEFLDRGGNRMASMGYAIHEQTDSSGLIYMKARFYLPMYGRFTNPDPARDQHSEETQSWNINSYVRNSPMMNTDPTGLWTWRGVWEETKRFFSHEFHGQDSIQKMPDGAMLRINPVDSKRDVKILSDGNLLKAEFKTKLSHTESSKASEASALKGNILARAEVTQTKGTYATDVTAKFGATSIGAADSLKIGSSLNASGSIGIRAFGYEITLNGHIEGGLQLGAKSSLFTRD